MLCYIVYSFFFNMYISVDLCYYNCHCRKISKSMPIPEVFWESEFPVYMWESELPICSECRNPSSQNQCRNTSSYLLGFSYTLTADSRFH